MSIRVGKGIDSTALWERLQTCPELKHLSGRVVLVCQTTSPAWNIPNLAAREVANVPNRCGPIKKGRGGKTKRW